ncbi:uncharacterized protein LOC120092826 isoform X4 [Benincasa hispida]|uniref:uncharacterized protein LOC120092826 isoform X4 n=1 Tax=Benincasa hispida TaxID=102211 RepID=UPI0018FF9E03|nr:uncharacterized protein LOC120092826 isoform X4 [Benincasa hispida]
MSHYSINYYQSQAIRSTMKLWWLQHLTGKGNSNLRRSMHLPSLFNGTILVSISAALSEESNACIGNKQSQTNVCTKARRPQRQTHALKAELLHKQMHAVIACVHRIEVVVIKQMR